MSLWNSSTGEERVIASYEGERIVSAAIRLDGKMVATGPTDWNEARLKIWEVTTGSVLFRLPGHVGSVVDLEFSPDGKTLASVGDSTVRLWDVATGNQLATLTAGCGLQAVTFSSDGRRLFAGGGEGPLPKHELGRIAVWDVPQNRR